MQKLNLKWSSLSKAVKGIFLSSATVITITMVNACTSLPQEEAFSPALNSSFSIDSDNIVLTVPDREEREQYQLLIARLTQLLSSPDASHEQRAQILYQLGILYDRLGLDVSARTMFMNALVEVPDYANAYNFIGIYLASTERFSEAYEAYDAVLEINPKEVYAYFNRGIALYYGKRAKLGIADLEKFYEANKNDPFRMAWLYILEREVYGKDFAQERLSLRRSAVDQEVDWGLEVLDYMLGKISEKQVIEAIKSKKLGPMEKAQRLCEAYFYLAKMADFAKQYKKAYDYFHLCVTTNVSGYLEYRYAQLEIMRYKRAEFDFVEHQVAQRIYQEQQEYLKQQAKEAFKFFEDLFHKEYPNEPYIPFENTVEKPNQDEQKPFKLDQDNRKDECKDSHRQNTNANKLMQSQKKEVCI